MGINKVLYGNQTLIDISDSTITAAGLLDGLIAYNASGERIIGEMAQIIIDNAMSDISENPVQNKIVKAYIDSLLGGGDLASMLELSLSDVYHVDTDANAAATIASALNIDGFGVNIGTSGIKWKRPTVIVPEIEWGNSVDDNYDYTGQANVRVVFGTAGEITKNVTFKKPGEGKVYAVKLSNNSAIIPTGLNGNYGYRYYAQGHTLGTNQCVFVDAFVSTSQRATGRVLGSSGNFQLMWPGNRQYYASDAGIDYKKMFEATYGANYIELKQGGTVYTPSVSGHTASGSVGAEITLMNSVSGGLGNGVLQFAGIINESGDRIAYFAPYKIDGSEVVLINIHGLTSQQILDIVQNGDSAEYGSRILRPTLGELIEITQAEDV